MTQQRRDKTDPMAWIGDCDDSQHLVVGTHCIMCGNAVENQSIAIMGDLSDDELAVIEEELTRIPTPLLAPGNLMYLSGDSEKPSWMGDEPWVKAGTEERVLAVFSKQEYALFFAAARSDVPRLIEALRQERASNKALIEALTDATREIEQLKERF